MPGRFPFGYGCYTVGMGILGTDLLQEATRRLVEEFQPEEIILFGSHAWGIPTEHSDIDVFVIVPKSALTPHELAARGYRALRGLSLPIEVHVRTRREFERFRHVPASLEHQVYEEGKRLYG